MILILDKDRLHKKKFGKIKIKQVIVSDLNYVDLGLSEDNCKLSSIPSGITNAAQLGLIFVPELHVLFYPHRRIFTFSICERPGFYLNFFTQYSFSFLTRIPI